MGPPHRRQPHAAAAARFVGGRARDRRRGGRGAAGVSAGDRDARRVGFTLLEATGKKARFLEATAAALGLANVTVVNDRAETAGQDREAHREQYDAVLARAVGRMPVLLELTVPFARIGGHVLAIKGAQADAEIIEARAALHALHAKVVETRRTATGTIVIIEKARRTGKMYPRRPGEPKRAPLGVSRDG